MRAGPAPPLLLVRGDLALAAPAAERLVAALAGDWGVEPTRVRQPEELAALADDLRTYSMFAPGKIVVATATGALADRDAAAELLAEAVKAKHPPGAELDGKSREAALRLLQVVRLHDLDPAGAPAAEILDALPDKLFADRKGAEADAVRTHLAPLLAAAVEAGLTGVGASEVSLLADLLRDGLPERHLLVLVESAVASAHPLVVALERRGAVADAGRLEKERDGAVAGLERLVAELARETGVGIDAKARAELGRRTLRVEDVRQGREENTMGGESVARFAAEYRKLAGLAGGGAIDLEMVEANVDDRGLGNVWAVRDAVVEGDTAAALAEIARRMRSADDPTAERLSLFGQLAKLARDLVAVQGAIVLSGARSGVRSYPQFKSEVAPKLKGKISGIASNPFARTHEYPLQKLYLAASRRDAAALARWPAKLLETERRLKGDSDDPDTALALLVTELARVSAPTASAPAGRGRLR